MFRTILETYDNRFSTGEAPVNSEADSRVLSIEPREGKAEWDNFVKAAADLSFLTDRHHTAEWVHSNNCKETPIGVYLPLDKYAEELGFESSEWMLEFMRAKNNNNINTIQRVGDGIMNVVDRNSEILKDILNRFYKRGMRLFLVKRFLSSSSLQIATYWSTSEEEAFNAIDEELKKGPLIGVTRDMHCYTLEVDLTRGVLEGFNSSLEGEETINAGAVVGELSKTENGKLK